MEYIAKERIIIKLKKASHRSQRMTWTTVWSALLFCTVHVQAFSLSKTRRTSSLFVSISPSTRIPSPVDGDNGEWSLDTSVTGMGFYDLDENENNMFSFDTSSDIISDTIREEVDILEEREDRLYIDEFGVKRKVERCILVGVEELSAARRSQSDDQQPFFSLQESMTEMRELIKTAGMEIAGEVTQRLNEINPRTYIGTGKVEEANELMQKAADCSTIVFDAELTPRQQKHLENSFNKKILQDDFLVAGGEIKVIDRTALILDIFAQHAKTKEGKLQVELALHEYRKPRLTKMWTHLERQSGAGGVGLRGPGESQLEIDKRLVRDRIITLKHKIDDVQKHRTMHRLSRKRTGLPFLSLVGYTNAGKSSLLNYLTRAGVMAEPILFATLDPTTRKVKLPGYKTHPEVLLTDTVGFIQKLPTHLVAAFRATLEEVKEADVLIHVIDVSNPSWEKQELAVLSVLKEMKVDDKPIVRVLNKIDLLEPDDAEYLKYDAATSENTVAVSAKTGEGLQDFVAVVEDAMSQLLVPIEILLPYSKGDELNVVHEQGNVEVVDYRETGTYCRAMVPTAVAKRLEPYSTSHISMEPSGDRKSGDWKMNTEDDEEIDWAALAKGRH
ncbi:GTPase [Fistulifera solaris]|uniref:GTPase n=1 Tax=Fistulifera solaris TaxID=1519565 RepID=A0A1Z5KE66_FISSO|nr:GTPase [Fistulifera solaris]|eukprot:GAX24620.1 GTPase [Fistulifera solaris]